LSDSCQQSCDRNLSLSSILAEYVRDNTIMPSRLNSNTCLLLGFLCLTFTLPTLTAAAGEAEVARLRDENACPGCNLAGDALSGMNLGGADLNHANLTGANLSNSNLSGANLTNANLTNANLSNANFSQANLSNANLTGAKCGGYVCPTEKFSNANTNGNTIMPDGSRGG
jgi:uncharacterized protein YjbI with pentapeptide repeats